MFAELRIGFSDGVGRGLPQAHVCKMLRGAFPMEACEINNKIVTTLIAE